VIDDDLRRPYGQPRRHLIVAGYPTPNGPLHLGHLGGPFLRADVLRRHLLSRGHSVRTVGTSDSWESNILFTAAKRQWDPSRTAGHYQGRITAALRDFELAHDAYLDIHAAQHATAHRRYSDELVDALHAEGRLTLRTEQLLFDPVYERVLAGCWLAGRCPGCRSEAVGNSCESCGLWFGPHDMLDAAPRPLPEGQRPAGLSPSSVAVVSAFATPARGMRPEEVAARIGHVDTYLPIVEAYWRWNPAGIRLTYPIGWGVPWPMAGPDHGSVHYSYGTGLVAASKVIGRYVADRYGEPDPMGRAGDTTTIAVGGVDAVMPWLVLLGLTTTRQDFRPYDYFLFNQFLDLHGAKFSTSRRHTIWVGDYVAAGLDVDCARLYLATLSPATRTTDFRCEVFADFAAAWAARLDHAVLTTVKSLADRPLESVGPAGAALIDALAAQDGCLRLPDTDIAAAVEVLDGWLARIDATRADDLSWWHLWGLALFAAPLMPGWAGRLWAALGLDGEPSVHTAIDAPGWIAQRYAGLRPPAIGVLRTLMARPSTDGYPDDPTITPEGT